MREYIIKNQRGEEVVLNSMEKFHLDYMKKQLRERFQNALGFEVAITTLTSIVKEVSEQKFFRIAPADYVPMKVGQGAFSSNLTTYTSFQIADDFSTGIIDLGGDNSRLASSTAGVSSVNIAIKNWAKSCGYNIFQLEEAARSGNWDLVTTLEEARKTNWDLGIQKIAFLGLSGDSSVLGLFNQSGVTVDTATLSGPISQLDVTDLKQFCAVILNVYRANNNRTAWPTHFVIPESDYLGLAAPASAQFPIKSVLEQLLETFKIMTNNPGFKILPCAYADIANSGQTYQQYALLNYDPKSIVMNIPVDYTNTLANSIDGFTFQNAGYGQFTGVNVIRPLELYYLRFTP